MKPWLCRHRTAILVTYCVLALTIVLVLQVLEAQGQIP